jgi:hypothetical protein
VQTEGEGGSEGGEVYIAAGAGSAKRFSAGHYVSTVQLPNSPKKKWHTSATCLPPNYYLEVDQEAILR